MSTVDDRGGGTAFRVVLYLAAGAAHAGAFASLAAAAPEGVTPFRWLGAALGLTVLSFRSAARSRRARRSVAWRTAAVAARVVQVGLLVLLAELGFAAALAGLVLALQGILLSRASDPAPAVAALGLSVVQSLLALGAAPGVLTLLAFGAVLAAVPAAGALLHVERARQRTLLFRRASVLPRPSGRQTATRIRYALGLSALVAPPALAALGLLSLANRIGWPDVVFPPPPPSAELVEEITLESPEAGESDARTWSSRLGFGGGASRTSNDPVAWVRVRRADSGDLVRDRRPLWLKSLVLDTFTSTELRQLEIAHLPRFADRDDGVADGWVRFSAAGAPGGEDLLELRLHQVPLRVAGAGGDVLLYGQPPVALEAPRLRYHPDRAMVSEGFHDDWFGYRVLTPASGLSALFRTPPPARTGTGRAAHRDPRYLQLPPPSRALDRIGREARAMVGGARTDAERVGRLVSTFRTEFDYSLEGSGFSGLASVVSFLDRREGYCTSFSSAAVLMLRSLGIPTRAAVGYLVSEWDEDEAAYLARVRHAHAWIEVHFADGGWVPFDPTPTGRRDDALARAGNGDAGPAGLGAWGAQLAGDVRDLALARHGATPGDLLDTLAGAPEALLESARRRPAAALALALALAALAFVVLTRPARTRRGPLGIPLPARSRAESFWERVLIALEPYGFRPGPAQTPREFAHGVVAHGGEAFAPIAAAAEMLYRARWGGEAPSKEERRFVAGFLRSLRH